MINKNVCKPFILSPPFCLHNGAVVLDSSTDTVRFGIVDTNNTVLRERLEKAAKSESKRAEFEAVSRSALERAVSKLYAEDGMIADVMNTSSLLPKKAGGEGSELRAAVVLLDSLLEEARSRGATDIHIQENSVRFRVRGLLENEIVLAHDRASELVQRIKLLAKLNVLEKRRGQDGQFTTGGTQPLFVRVSCVPAVSQKVTDGCESIVLRLLDPSRLPLTAEALGFNNVQQERLCELSSLQNGLILVCGPTGAGKSTTAAAMLEYIVAHSCGSKKIVSIEDPPEYVLPGITQIQVNNKTGIDFAGALRLIFRQDPDVLFIGEIRDSETAHTAVQAALTGHLVFATLHTSGFAETVLRLEDLGIPVHFAAQVIKGIIIQHLVHHGNTVTLDAHVLAMNGMTTDAMLRGNDRRMLESCMQGASL